MRIFMTGATGFIGGHFLRFLLREEKLSKDQIHCLVRTPSRLAGDLASRVTVHQGNETSLEKYQDVIQSCSLIFHLGGNAKFGNRGDYETSNVEFTRLLIAAASKSNQLKRFVFTSSIGAVDRVPGDSCQNPLTEASTPYPTSAYGKSKLACEKMLTASSLPYVILRPTWVYGPGMRSDSHIRVFLDAVSKNKPSTWFNFPGKVSLVSIEDMVRALWFVAAHPGAVRQTYFAADNQPLSLGNLFRILGEILGSKKSGRLGINFGIPWIMRWLRPWLPVKMQNIFSDVLYASSAKLQALGFRFTCDLRRGLRETAHAHFAEQKTGIDGREDAAPLAVVTGGAGGIGKALAEKLYAHGYEMALVDCDAAVREVAASIGADYLIADLSQEVGVQSAIESMNRRGSKIALWVNNAGVGLRGPLLENDPLRLSQMLDLNCKALAVLSRAVLEKFKEKKNGILINIASSAGFQPLPYMAAYAASKRFVTEFTEALIGEFKDDSKIKILCISPSGTQTNFQAAAGVKSDEKEKLLQPEEVAAGILSCLRKKSGHYVIGERGKRMALLAQILPGPLKIRLWEYLMRKSR